MARGTITGILAGTAVSALVAGAAVVVTDRPGATAPEAAAVEVPAGSEFDQSKDDRAAALPVPQATPEAGDVARVEAPEPDDLSPLGTDARESAAQPETGSSDVALRAPEAGADAAGVDLDRERPVEPRPQASAPEAPAGEADLSISTDPAQPRQPDPAGEDSGFAPAADAAEDPAPDAGAAPADAPEDGALPALPEEVEVTGFGAGASGTIGDMAGEVTTGRLPSVGGPASGAQTQNAAPAAPATAEAPLARFATAFDDPGDKPLFSVVLISDGTAPVAPGALGDLPFPVTVAVDTGWDGATEAARRYRDAGIEVMAMVDLPEGARAADVEVAMETYLARVPEAVAILEGPGDGLAADREAGAQLARILHDSGHGAVMFSQGLNTTQKLVARAGVPSAAVYRDFDGGGQSAAVMRRFLDQAAFRAGQEDPGVIMLGRLRPATLAALAEWSGQDRAARVTIAPVSTLLRAGR